MNAVEIIRAVYAHGGKLTLDGDALRVSAPAPLPDSLRQALREHKPSIMVALGAPLDVVVCKVLAELRQHLPQSLQQLSDEKLLALINWSIIAAWERAIQSLEGGR
jgi:hypothetical protein